MSSSFDYQMYKSNQVALNKFIYTEFTFEYGREKKKECANSLKSKEIP